MLASQRGVKQLAHWLLSCRFWEHGENDLIQLTTDLWGCKAEDSDTLGRSISKLNSGTPLPPHVVSLEKNCQQNKQKQTKLYFP